MWLIEALFDLIVEGVLEVWPCKDKKKRKKKDK